MSVSDKWADTTLLRCDDRLICQLLQKCKLHHDIDPWLSSPPHCYHLQLQASASCVSEFRTKEKVTPNKEGRLRLVRWEIWPLHQPTSSLTTTFLLKHFLSHFLKRSGGKIVRSSERKSPAFAIILRCPWNPSISINYSNSPLLLELAVRSLLFFVKSGCIDQFCLFSAWHSFNFSLCSPESESSRPRFHCNLCFHNSEPNFQRGYTHKFELSITLTLMDGRIKSEYCTINTSA